MKRFFKILSLTVVLIVVLAGAFGFWLIRNPLFGSVVLAPEIRPTTGELSADVDSLAAIIPSRNSANLHSLNRAANYIRQEFQRAGCDLEEHPFTVNGDTYRNISCLFGPKDADRLVLGAHYDVHYDNNPGADDNASGVAGILAVARMIAKHQPKLKRRVELIAYTLEEQPHFGEGTMGSQQHAQKLMAQKVPLRLMISVEMIGYFTDEPESQKFPSPHLKPLYPNTGNFIGVVGKLFDRGNVRRVKALMREASSLPVYSLNAPATLSEASLSDHASFWELNLPALMVTDTAFLRNPNYHKPTDKPDTLDYNRMADVVSGLYRVATHF